MINRIGWRTILGGVVLALSICVASTIAQEHHDAPARPAQPAHSDAPKSDAMHTLTDPHAPPVDGDRPVVPTDAAAWAGTMLIIIIAMFLMAAVIGPMVRLEVPPESHHDDHGHGHDHDHGHDDHGGGHGHGH